VPLRLASFLMDFPLHLAFSISAVLLSIVSCSVHRQRMLFGFLTVSRWARSRQSRNPVRYRL
jgi:hypothetical protein